MFRVPYQILTNKVGDIWQDPWQKFKEKRKKKIFLDLKSKRFTYFCRPLLTRTIFEPFILVYDQIEYFVSPVKHGNYEDFWVIQVDMI